MNNQEHKRHDNGNKNQREAEKAANQRDNGNSSAAPGDHADQSTGAFGEGASGADISQQQQ